MESIMQCVHAITCSDSVKLVVYENPDFHAVYSKRIALEVLLKHCLDKILFCCCSPLIPTAMKSTLPDAPLYPVVLLTLFSTRRQG